MDLFTEFRQPGPGLAALEDLLAELFLKTPNSGGDVRLHAIQRLGSSRKGACLGDCHQCFQKHDVHTIQIKDIKFLLQSFFLK